MEGQLKTAEEMMELNTALQALDTAIEIFAFARDMIQETSQHAFSYAA